MNANTLGFLMGLFFGAGLLLAGLADPDKIVGTLRLKDLHALKTIIIFVLVGMVGTWLLDLAHHAHYSIKPAAILSVAIGGALLGVGFGLTGYCPGTGLACAAAGRLDAVVCVIGMLVGAFVFIWVYPSVAQPLDAIANYGKTTLPEITGIPRFVWGLALIGAGVIVLPVLRKK